MPSSRLPRRVGGLCLLLGLVACSTAYNPLDDYREIDPVMIMATPDPASDNDYPAEQVARGKYLVGLLGCGSCHTNGALLGEPRMDQLLAGSRVGIAYTNPLANRNPGVVYPSNLTPDPETGLGNWTVPQIVTMLQTGMDQHGGQSLPVMPWPSFAAVTSEDAEAVAVYLKSLPPVRHAVPARVFPGQRARAPYIHFGIYQSRQ